MHNVLKGKRVLSTEVGDRLLYHLRLSALDLVEPEKLRRHLLTESSDDYSSHCYLPVLDGRLGPSHPWPDGIEMYERFPISVHSIARMFHPVVVRVAEDVRMYPLFSQDDLLLLDQSRHARMEIDEKSLYIVKRGRVGLVRRLRVCGQTVFMLTDDSMDRPAAWERLPLEGQQLTHFVRARAQLIAREIEWNA
jgi:hypothetical protein